jgi:PBS lyase HEAT-like repeat
MRARVTAIGASLLLGLGTTVASATEFQDALRHMDDGRLRFSFETREGVWGDGHSIITTDDDESDWDCDCREGPGRMQLTFRGGKLRDVKFRVGGEWRSSRPGDVDLGEVPASEASDVLLDLAVDQGNEDLIFAATVAEGFDDWKRILAVARDDSLDDDVREQCVFWLGCEASEIATRGLKQIVEDDDEELELREHAIFALSQQEDDEAFDSLSRIALNNRHPQLREQAMFWLGQSEDPRVLDFFEEVLFEK